jgi:hypothetical protein
MEISQIIWLIICGVVIIAGFWLGSYYLSEWKEACVEYAKYKAKSEVNLKRKIEDKWIDTYESEIAENLVQKQICLPVWTVSFTLVLIFLVIVACTLFK